jgi:hypothetical protein
MVAETFLVGSIVRVLEKTLIASIDGEQRRINVADLGLSRRRLLALRGKRLEFSLRGNVAFNIEILDD